MELDTLISFIENMNTQNINFKEHCPLAGEKVKYIKGLDIDEKNIKIKLAI